MRKQVMAKEAMAKEAGRVMHSKGHLFVFIGPGGSGKTAMICRIQAERPECRFVPTTTTRPARPGEAHGREYFFASDGEFEHLRLCGGLLEWERIHGHLYGTSRRRIEEVLVADAVGLTSLDYKGGRAVRHAYPRNTTTIFVQPASLDELRTRLEARAGSTPEDVAARLHRTAEELRHADEFDHVITNRNGHLDDAVAAALHIMEETLAAGRLAGGPR